MRQNRLIARRILVRCRALTMVRDLLSTKSGVRPARNSLDDTPRLAVDSAPELLADVAVEADTELGFFGVGLAVFGGFGGFGDDGGLAVWDEGAVGGDVGDGLVDYFGGVLEGAGGGQGLLFAGERVGKERSLLLLLSSSEGGQGAVGCLLLRLEESVCEWAHSFGRHGGLLRGSCRVCVKEAIVSLLRMQLSTTRLRLYRMNLNINQT